MHPLRTGALLANLRYDRPGTIIPGLLRDRQAALPAP